MIQELLVFFSLTCAIVFLGMKFWKLYFSKKTKCEGCAVHQLHQLKMQRLKK